MGCVIKIRMKKDNADIPLLEVNLLRLFDLLYGLRSVTRAAEQLNMAQPTVSIWLSKLRRQLNDPLFVRTPSGMQPTPVADALIGDARSALESLQRISLWDSKFDPATAERRFCICMSDAANITLLPEILAHVRKVAPRVRLKTARIDERTARLMEEGQADLAIGLLTKLGKGFYQQSFFNQEWVCLAAPWHPRIADHLSLETYQREAHVDIIPGVGQHLLNSALAEHRISRRIVLELPGYLGLSVIVGRTDLLATLPRQMGEQLAEIGGLRVYPCPFPIPSFVVKQHWHARAHHDAGNIWLRSVCRTVLLPGPGGEGKRQ